MLKLVLDFIKKAEERFNQSKWKKPVLTSFKYVFNGLIIIYLVREVLRIGWKETLSLLPVQPGFYALFLVLYFALPISEFFIYKLVWPITLKKSISAFITKKIYNNSLVGYSGDFYLSWWASQFLGKTRKEALSVVKDNAILSTVGSSFFAVTMLVLFLVFGDKPERFINTSYLSYSIFGLILLLVIALILPKKFREKVFQLGFKVSISIIGIHFIRLIFLGTIQIVQWQIVMPDINLTTWITYVALQIITTRIPLVPNRDLLFMAMGIELASTLSLPLAAITALFLASNILDKLVNVILYLIISYLKPKVKEHLEPNV